MERIGVRELRQSASRYLDRVKVGETIEVTEHGRLIALLVPPGPGLDWERMIASGAVLPGRGDVLSVEPIRRSGHDATAALAELRASDR